MRSRAEDDRRFKEEAAARAEKCLTLAAKAQERRQELETLEKEREAASQRRSDEEQLLGHTTRLLRTLEVHRWQVEEGVVSVRLCGGLIVDNVIHSSHRARVLQEYSGDCGSGSAVPRIQRRSRGEFQTRYS